MRKVYRVFFFFFFFSLKKKKKTSMLEYREWFVARTNQIVSGMYLAPTRASFLFFGLRESAVRKMESSFRMRNFGFSVFFYVYFTALYEKCDTTGQMKDIRLPIVSVLLMLWKWWIVVREKFEFCSTIIVIVPSRREWAENFWIKAKDEFRYHR